MATRQTNKLQIPVDISRYVVVYGLQKAFAIFLYLKFHSSGKLHKDSPVFKSVMKALRISDDRTYRKHFNKLIELNWINLNESSGIYHFRGFDRLRIEYNIRSKQATTLFYKHLKILDVYLMGVMLCAEVNKQKYFWEVVVRRKLRPVANKRDATNPARVYADGPQPKYYGLCLPQIAEMFGCSKTRASQLRKKAADAGFIQTIHKFTEITRLPKPDYNIRPHMEEQFPELKSRLRFSIIVVKGVAYILVLVQTFDEIIPKIQFKTISKFNNLVVAPQIKKAAAIRIAEAAKIAA